MTKDTGDANVLFGGNMLAWMDEAAALHARALTGESRMVTLRFGETLFKRQVKVGDIVEFHSERFNPGRSSVSFDIKATVNGELVFSTECTFVAVDEHGVKKAIAKFAAKNTEGH